MAKEKPRVKVIRKKFFAMGGSHVCSDDFFNAQALLAREDE